MNFLTILLIFNLTPNYLNDDTILKTGVVYASVVYSLVSIFQKFIFPNLFLTDVTDNIFVQNWGHSYVADFLVFSVPLLIYNFTLKKGIFNVLPLVPITIAIVASNSRSSIVALILGILFIKSENYLQKIIKVIAIFCLLISLVYIFFFSNYLKSPDGSRPEYWSQAISGFVTSPFVGIGPGNFGIINRLYRQDITNNSNYAHSSILESLSGNGIFFTFLAFGLITYGLWYQYHHHNLFFVLGLISLINSLLDPSWSSPGILVISLIFIFWKIKITSSPKFLLIILTTLISIYLVSKTVSDILFSNGNYNLSLKFDPFNPSPLAKMVASRQNQIIQLYRQDPYFLNLLSDVKYLPQNEGLIYESIRLDPLGSTNQILRLIYFYSSVNNHQKLEQVIPILDDHVKHTALPFSQSLEVAKSIYKLGIYNWNQKDYPKAIANFEKAVIYSNGWSHFQLELVTALWNSGQTEKAQGVLADCQKNFSSATHCQIFESKVKKSGWPTPGSFATTISSFVIQPVDDTPTSPQKQ